MYIQYYIITHIYIYITYIYITLILRNRSTWTDVSRDASIFKTFRPSCDSFTSPWKNEKVQFTSRIHDLICLTIK